MVPQSLARIIRAARERIGLTQAALAEAVGVAPNHVARLESGEKALPRFDTVARIAVALGLSLDKIAVECGYRIAAEVSFSDAQRLIKLAKQQRAVLLRLEEAVTTLRTSAEYLELEAGAAAPLRRRRR